MIIIVIIVVILVVPFLVRFIGCWLHRSGLPTESQENSTCL